MARLNKYSENQWRDFYSRLDAGDTVTGAAETCDINPRTAAVRASRYFKEQGVVRKRGGRRKKSVPKPKPKSLPKPHPVSDAVLSPLNGDVPTVPNHQLLGVLTRIAIALEVLVDKQPVPKPKSASSRTHSTNGYHPHPDKELRSEIATIRYNAEREEQDAELRALQREEQDEYGWPSSLIFGTSDYE